MDKLLNKIEKNKKHRLKHKERKVLKQQKIDETTRERAEKRMKKDRDKLLNDVHEEFIDDNLKEPEQIDDVETNKATEIVSDYTILGNDDFQKKLKVFKCNFVVTLKMHIV